MSTLTEIEKEALAGLLEHHGAKALLEAMAATAGAIGTEVAKMGVDRTKAAAWGHDMTLLRRAARRAITRGSAADG